MASATIDPRDRNGSPLRRRATAILLTIAVHALLLFVLSRLAPSVLPARFSEPAPLSFESIPAREADEAREPDAERSEAATPRLVRPAARPAPNRPREAEVEPTEQFVPPPGFILMTREQFARSDLSGIPSAPAGRGADGIAGEGAQVAAAEGAGGGRGDETLHNAEWYRPPTEAELAAYLPARLRTTGWGMIACRTVEGFRVEDCRELDQSPPGSGFSRAVRQAAWQFRVLPPRIGGRPQVGAWVRIRIDYRDGNLQ